jgi:hypothetical protein
MQTMDPQGRPVSSYIEDDQTSALLLCPFEEAEIASCFDTTLSACHMASRATKYFALPDALSLGHRNV